MNDKYQNMKQAAGALSSLSCSLILIVPLLIILCCALMFVWSMLTGGK
jgi:hypothetical protein